HVLPHRRRDPHHPQEPGNQSPVADSSRRGRLRSELSKPHTIRSRAGEHGCFRPTSWRALIRAMVANWSGVQSALDRIWGYRPAHLLLDGRKGAVILHAAASHQIGEYARSNETGTGPPGIRIARENGTTRADDRRSSAGGRRTH